MNFGTFLRSTLNYKIIKAALVAAFYIPAILFLGILMSPQRGDTKQRILTDGDITVVIQSSRKDKSTEMKIDRQYLGLNERLYEQDKAAVTTDSLSVFLLLPDLTPATEYYDKPISQSQTAQNEAILAEGDLVDIDLRQGSRTPASVSAMIKSLSWIKSSDGDSVPGYELFHDRAFIKNGIRESYISLIPNDPEYRDRVYIECPINNINTEKRLLCRCHTGFANQLYGSFSFSKSKFDGWKEIHKKVSAWVESRVTK
jgi:hypothetical protein